MTDKLQKETRTLLHLGHRRLLWRRKQTKVDALKRKLGNGCIGIAAYSLLNDIGDWRSAARGENKTQKTR